MLPVRFLIAGSAILLWLYLNIRKRPSAITPELRKALEVYDRDPVTGQQQLDIYFQKQGEQEDGARKLLWVQAQTDARSAKDLRRRLLQDMKTHEFARTEVSKYSDRKSTRLNS